MSSTFTIPPDPFGAIANNLAKISDSMRMAGAGAGPLAERSVNVAPQQIRAKIRQFINSGEMKIGEFQRKIGVSAASYNHFMKLSGRDKGSGSDTYFGAAAFFKRRQLAGVKTSRQKKIKANDNPTTAGGSTASSSSSSSAKSKKDIIAEVEAADDVSQIKLAGEDTDSVPVMDTCDDIRNNINKYLRETPYATGASFIRAINRALPETSERRASAPVDPARAPRAWSSTPRTSSSRSSASSRTSPRARNAWRWRRPGAPKESNCRIRPTRASGSDRALTPCMRTSTAYS
ncbi:hypothetical protein PV08_04365 [Exophiala spinifera]|uniref:DUF7726 domain-containing protein n=1 Tax=Exophiala spinifera TaxID=91928 RepID=A0A0D2C0J6_9EURO|nr:uncharacterized protein PV08_04365 [Exophiala spinifera]KIW17174.1 hypothetical protein PV08_04365 [Exophiala spinifera]